MSNNAFANASAFEAVRPTESTLPMQTADQISRLIVERRWTSKDRLPSEFELAELLNVGRGTVREAVKLLVGRNVLDIRRGKGTYIAENPGEVPDPLGFQFYPNQYQLGLDLAEVRGQLEPWMARTAALHARPDDYDELERVCKAVEDDVREGRDHSDSDVQFHLAIARRTRNIVAPKMIPIITYAVPLFVSLTESKLRMQTLTDHREVVKAIIAGDPDAAEAAMARHIEYNRSLIQSILEEKAKAQSEKKS